MKILNNCTPTKCGECAYFEHCKQHRQKRLDGRHQLINPDTIDKDCPLRDVEVKDISKQLCPTTLRFDPKDVDHIIIVKKEKK